MECRAELLRAPTSRGSNQHQIQHGQRSTSSQPRRFLAPLPRTVAPMKNKVTCRLVLRFRFLPAAFAIGCATTAHPAATDPDRIRMTRIPTMVEPASTDQERMRSLLVSEIRRKLANSSFPVEWDSSRVDVSTFSSLVVPGLRYSQGTYRTPELSHGFAFAFGGSSEERERVLRTASDWAALAFRWRPRNPEEALHACSELIGTVGADPDPRFPPVVIDDSLSLNSARPAWAYSGEILPRVSIEGRRAHVLVWALESGIRRRYSCALRWDSPQFDAQLTVTDSVPGEGLLPQGP